ncbi:ABC transporter family substrate-binding protein [Phaeacidiphilus oryzae]|uniref:ABC transporter family substrate-binding protein n=1 Tax=Phaeacidiphilus oryzae TaxID=348818 RepID=UPI0005647B16|nr:ABC transporter family substrate-binding protein [Phaeacidiphilus oryzae]
MSVHPHTTPARAALGAALALGVSLAAAGCSGGGSVPPAAADVAAAASHQVRDGGTVRWALDSVPATFNAFRPEATAGTGIVDDALLPRLFTQDAHGRSSADPAYLASAKQVSDSPQTIEYHLNPAAKWSDGKPLSAADFKAQWQALSGRQQGYGAVRADGYDAIASVEQGSDPHTVRVVFQNGRSFGPWRGLFSPLYPAAAMSSATAFTDGLRNGLPATAGPFTLASVDRKTGEVRLTRDPHWWGSRPHVAAVSFQAVPDDRRLAGLRAGRLDVADLSTAVEDGTATAAQAAGVPGYALHRAAAPAYEQVTLNGFSGALADPELRRAVATAIDRPAIAKAVLAPLGLPAATLGNHLVMADQEGYADNSSRLAGGAERAAQMLAAAGWTDGSGAGSGAGGTTEAKGDAKAASTAASGAAASASAVSKVAASASAAGSGSAVRSKDGRPLTLTMVIPSGSATAKKVADLVVAQLAAAGIDTRVKAVDAGALLSQNVSAGDYDLALFGWPASEYPVADEAALYEKPAVGPDGTVQRGLNLSGAGTDQIDQLLAKSLSATDAKAAADAATQADQRIWAIAPSVPLYQKPQLVSVRKGLVGAGAFGLETPDFTKLGFTR